MLGVIVAERFVADDKLIVVGRVGVVDPVGVVRDRKDVQTGLGRVVLIKGAADVKESLRCGAAALVHGGGGAVGAHIAMAEQSFVGLPARFGALIKAHLGGAALRIDHDQLTDAQLLQLGRRSAALVEQCLQRVGNDSRHRRRSCRGGLFAGRRGR